MSNFNMDDYVPVNERIEKFLDKYPDGSMQSEIVELTASRVTFKAYAYRSSDDQRPGVGHSSLEIPGSTPFTRGSEIENAETSAWGRAIAALGFEVKRGLASAEEVRNKQPERGERTSVSGGARSQSATTPAPAQYRRDELAALMAEKSLDLKAVEIYATMVGIPKGQRATNDQMDALIDAVRGHGIDEAIEPAVARTADEATTVAGDPAGPAELPPSAGPPPKNRTVEEAIEDAKKKAGATA